MSYMRRLLPLVLALLLLPAAAAADPCDDSVADCAQGSDLAIPISAETINAIVAVKHTPAALALYRRLIPKPYSMPADPAVGIYTDKLDAPARLPGNPEANYSNWSEDGIDLRVAHDGEEGWYRLAVPVTSDFEWQIGRAAGFPKIHASATRSDTGGGHRMAAGGGARTLIDLAWTPAAGGVSPGLRRYVFNQDPIFLLIDPLKGPSASRYRFVVKPIAPIADFGAPSAAQVAPVTALPEPQPGLVRYSVVDDLGGVAKGDGLPDVFPAGTG